MDLQQLQHYLGLENDDKRFGFLIAQPFIGKIHLSVLSYTNTPTDHKSFA